MHEINRCLLMWTRDVLYDKLRLTRERTVTIDEKLNSIIMALADISSALARKSENDIVPAYKDDEKQKD